MSFNGYWYVNAVKTCLFGGSKESSTNPPPGSEVETPKGDLGDIQSLTTCNPLSVDGLGGSTVPRNRLDVPLNASQRPNAFDNILVVTVSS